MACSVCCLRLRSHAWGVRAAGSASTARHTTPADSLLPTLLPCSPPTPSRLSLPRLRMVELGEEAIDFREMLSEIYDMAMLPPTGGRLALRELQRSGLGVQIIDAIVNIRKLVAWEGLACQKAAGRPGHLRNMRDWDLFVERHYKRLVEAEEENQAAEDALGDANSPPSNQQDSLSEDDAADDDRARIARDRDPAVAVRRSALIVPDASGLEDEDDEGEQDVERRRTD